MSNNNKVASVIVTYNRINKLRKSLSCYDSMKMHPDIIIVVNNNSNDGTDNMLSIWKSIETDYKKIVINLKKNMGGSGGFHVGEEAALHEDVNWILVADDDAYPDKNLIKEFRSYIENNREQKIAAVCTSVHLIDGSIDLGHRKTLNYKFRFIFNAVRCPADWYSKKQFDLDLFSYVGTFMNCDALRSIGLCNKDFFIYFDDTDHSIRLSKYGKIICIPSLSFVHDCGYITNDNSIVMTWREYYSSRNSTYMLKKHSRLTALYNICYTMLRCFYHHTTRPVCWKLVATGLWDGWNGRLGIHKKYKPGFNIRK